jgi:hemolysin activation/secretion protein
MSRAALSIVPLALVASLMPWGGVRAQVAAAPSPRAGEILRDELPAQKTMPALPAAAPQDAAGGDQGVKAPSANFVLRRLDVRGNTTLRQPQIDMLAEPYIGKKLGDAELASLIGTLRKRFEDEGLGLASIGFPTQDVSQGVLKVDVLEPKLARIDVPMAADAPVSEARVRGLLSSFHLDKGAVLNTLSLERVMFALNDSPGVQAKASLSPAGDEGVYNLSVEVTPRRSWDASVGLDNHGIGYAGRVRATGLVRWNNPLGIGDNLDVQSMLSTSGGVKVGRVAYELPVGYTPARLSLAYAKVNYSLAGTVDVLDPHGSATVKEANLSYPLMRSRNRTVMARVGYETKALSDHVTDTVDQTESRYDKRVKAVTGGLNLESRDQFLGGGFNGASVQLRWGNLRMDNVLDQAEDESLGPLGRAGNFAKAELQYSRLQGLSRTVSLYASVSQQLASRNLDAAEKMSLGGPRGVRAYPSGEGASDEATLITSELRLWLNRNWTVFALYDWAKGRRDRTPLPGSESENDIMLRGAGFGLSASYPDIVTVKASLAWRGHRKAETETGHDKPRVYVQAQHSF